MSLQTICAVLWVTSFVLLITTLEYSDTEIKVITKIKNGKKEQYTEFTGEAMFFELIAIISSFIVFVESSCILFGFKEG
jgi:hypothetical protein